MSKTYPVVLSIAGSDSSGGAGIQADIKTATELGCYAETAITALTAQNTQGVSGIENASPAFVGEQIDRFGTIDVAGEREPWIAYGAGHGHVCAEVSLPRVRLRLGGCGRQRHRVDLRGPAGDDGQRGGVLVAQQSPHR